LSVRQKLKHVSSVQLRRYARAFKLSTILAAVAERIDLIIENHRHHWLAEFIGR